MKFGMAYESLSTCIWVWEAQARRNTHKTAAITSTTSSKHLPESHLLFFVLLLFARMLHLLPLFVSLTCFHYAANVC